MKKQIRILAVILALSALIGCVGCDFSKTTVSSNPEEPPVSEVVDETFYHFFKTSEELHEWLSVKPFDKHGFLAEVRYWIERQENSGWEQCWKGLESGAYRLAVPCFDGVPASGQINICHGSDPDIRYDCTVDEYNFEVRLYYATGGKTDDEFIQRYVKYPLNKQTAVVYEAESHTVGDRELPVIRAQSSDSQKTIHYFTYDQIKVILYANGTALPESILEKFSLQYASRKVMALGNNDEKTGQNVFFGAQVHSVDELLDLCNTPNEQKLNAFLTSSGENQFPYDKVGVDSVEGLQELIETLEANGFYTMDECDDWGVLYFYDTKQYRVFFKRGEVTYRFDYMPRQAFNDILLSVDLKAAGSSKGYPDCVKLDVNGLSTLGTAELYYIPEFDSHIVFLF